MTSKNTKFRNTKEYAAHRRKIKKIKRTRRLIFIAALFTLHMAFFFIETSISGNTITSEEHKKTIADANDTHKETSFAVSDKQSVSNILGDNTVSQLSPDDWRLILVNSQNKLPDDYSIALTDLLYEQSIDSRAYPDLQQMVDACRAEGLSPRICSSYRSTEKQQQLFENKVTRLMSDGYSYTAATQKAGTEIAIPGYSEHQTGLALDIVDETHQLLDESQEFTAVQQWLLNNSWKYGFVLRYPNGKSDITGIIYEPWHYRYVGKTAAKEMHAMNFCLEEYIEYLNTPK